MEDGKYMDGSVWFFAPNKGAPVFFAVAFAASGGIHLWQTIHFKCWRLTGLYIFCAILFTGGFVVREVGAFNYKDLITYIVSVCLVYAAPPLYELANYYVLGRILYLVPYHSPIHPGRVLSTFAAISMVVEALNGNGVAYTANQSLPQSRRDVGSALLKTALLLQLVVVVLFLTLAVYFHVKCIKNGIWNSNVNNALTTLYISSGLILVRTIYRVVEYFDLSNVDYWEPDFDPMSLSPTIRYEWFFYFFEATLMLLNSVLLNVRHPRRWLPNSTKVYLTEDGETEIMGPGYKQERKFFVTLLDPFDIYGMIKGKDKETRFWDTHDNVETMSKPNSDPTPI